MFSSSGARQDIFWPNGSTGDFASGKYSVDGTSLEPLKPYLADVIIPKGMRIDRGGGDSHDAGSVSILTGFPLKTQDINQKPFASGPSLDQLLASKIGGQTPEPYLLQGVRLQVNRISKFISYDAGGYPVDYIQDPYTVYQRIIQNHVPNCAGGSTTNASIDLMRFKRRSILDLALAETGAMKNAVGMDAFEQQKLERMSDAIRSIEKRLDGSTVMQVSSTAHCDAVQSELAPPQIADTDDDFPKLLKLHLDLMVLAFELDITRIATISLSLGGTGGAPMHWLSWTDANGNSQPIEASHHNVSHGPERGIADYMPKLRVIDRWNFGQFAYLVGQLKSISDGAGTLLDNTVAWYATDVGRGDVHDDNNVPLIVAGRGGGALKTGRYLDLSGANHTCFLLSFLHLMGFPDVASFGASGSSARGPVLL